MVEHLQMFYKPEPTIYTTLSYQSNTFGNVNGQHIYVKKQLDEKFLYIKEGYKFTIEKTFVDITERTISLPTTFNSKDVVGINTNVFKGFNLNKIEIPSIYEKIGDKAFSGCNQMRSVTIESPSSLVSIGNGAFEGCTKLTQIQLPCSIQSLSPSALPNSITKITIITSTTSTSICGFSSLSYPTVDFIIDEGITEIMTDCFKKSIIKSISLPSTLNKISEFSFDGCSIKDKYILLPSSITTIEEDAFVACSIDYVFYCGTNELSTEYVFGEHVKAYVSESYPYSTLCGLIAHKTSQNICVFPPDFTPPQDQTTSSSSSHTSTSSTSSNTQSTNTQSSASTSSSSTSTSTSSSSSNTG